MTYTSALRLVPGLLLAVSAAAATPPASIDTLATSAGRVVVHPVAHASFVLLWEGTVLAVDPVGGGARYAAFPRPDVVLITHHHGDHFDLDTVRGVAREGTVVIAPPDVAESLASLAAIALRNGQSHTIGALVVRAVPAYNRTPERAGFHPQGRDNGYLLERDGARIYVSGDTEDVPEMAQVGPVDAAFLCLNLPWTMSVEQAAAAVALIRPRVLYPYHYRNRDGTQADLDQLRRLVPDTAGVEIRRLAWY